MERKILKKAVTTTLFSTLLFPTQALLVAGCSENDLPKYVQLGGLRVLALKAASAMGNFAEFSPGETGITITPIVSDYQGGSRALSYEAVGCADPGVSAGSEPTCDGAVDAVSLANGVVNITGAERTGEATAFTVNVPATILENRSAIDQYNGVNYLVTYVLTAVDGTTVKSFKRLPVSLASKTATKNRNPSIASVLADGVALTALPLAAVEIGAIFAAGSEETYDIMKSDLSLRSETEELIMTWFITDGELKLFRTIGTGTTKFTPPATAPTDHTAQLVGIARDERGGVSFIRVALP